MLIGYLFITFKEDLDINIFIIYGVHHSGMFNISILYPKGRAESQRISFVAGGSRWITTASPPDAVLLH